MSSSKAEQTHDLKSVYLNFKIVYTLLQEGYRFDDEEAARVLQQLQKALEFLQAEISRQEPKK